MAGFCPNFIAQSEKQAITRPTAPAIATIRAKEQAVSGQTLRSARKGAALSWEEPNLPISCRQTRWFPLSRPSPFVSLVRYDHPYWCFRFLPFFLYAPPFFTSSARPLPDRSITRATMESPDILVTVRNMSSGLSIANISAIPAGLIRMDSSTITSIKMPAPGTAAAPMEARVAVTMIPPSRAQSPIAAICH